MNTTLNVEAEKNPQFKAVRQWNSIVRKFCRDVPKKRHRRNLKSFDNCFTGRKAVDFLLEVLPELLDKDRVIKRENCVKLLKKFFDEGVICHFRGKKSIGFRDSSELYVLSADCEQTAVVVRSPLRRNVFKMKISHSIKKIRA
ncbi:hypothetical protein QR680_018544 [Steinernema hermaphroditum]|uniref:DEP domain-containing protein n=1 Tax=Steinernema hermaphroditum TaxID=289476 RepID=A0AA39HIA0_9BILA|nr:hypothetical protein QR680_018544 [Steinernema hermaphroditum]